MAAEPYLARREPSSAQCLARAPATTALARLPFDGQATLTWEFSLCGNLLCRSPSWSRRRPDPRSPSFSRRGSRSLTRLSQVAFGLPPGRQNFMSLKHLRQLQLAHREEGHNRATVLTILMPDSAEHRYLIGQGLGHVATVRLHAAPLPFLTPAVG